MHETPVTQFADKMRQTAHLLSHSSFHTEIVWLWIHITSHNLAFAARRLHVCQTQVVRWHNANWWSSMELHNNRMLTKLWPQHTKH